MFGLQPLRHISTLPDSADPDEHCERQVWGRFSGSRGRGSTAGVGFESGPLRLMVKCHDAPYCVTLSHRVLCKSSVSRRRVDNSLPQCVLGSRIMAAVSSCLLGGPIRGARSMIAAAEHEVSGEQCHARLRLNNAIRLSGMEWLWLAKRA